MGIWEIIIGFVVLLLSIIMIIVIILQEGHDAGLGTITGGADSFMKRGKAKTADAMFAKVTKICAITFFVFIVLLNAMSYFGWTGKSKETPAVETSTVSEASVEASTTEESKEEASTEASKDESKTEGTKTESSVASTEAAKEETSEAASGAESSAAEKSSEAAASTAESAA